MKPRLLSQKSTVRVRGQEIRRGIDSILDDHPNWIVYVRRDLRFPCQCYDTQTQEGSDSCPICFGAGYKIDLEKVKARRRTVGRGATLPSSDYLQAPGYLLEYPVTFYLKREIHPKDLDRIFVVEWNVPNAQVDASGVPVRLGDLYRIGLADEFYEDELSYTAAHCHELQFNRSIVERQLCGLRGIPVHDPSLIS